MGGFRGLGRGGGGTWECEYEVDDSENDLRGRRRALARGRRKERRGDEGGFT